VKPSSAPELVKAIQPLDAVYDWGGGLIWLLMSAGADVRTHTSAVAGHATRVSGLGDVPAFQPQTDVLQSISAGLRTKFDPKGLFNQGLMG